MVKARPPMRRPMTVTEKAISSWLASVGRVVVGQRLECRRQRDQGAHQPEHGADAHEDARLLEPLDGVELVLLQQLERLLGEALPLVVADQVEEEAHHHHRVVVLLQVAVRLARLSVAEGLARAQGADLEGVEVAVAHAQVDLVEEVAELDQDPDQADDGRDQHRVEQELRDGEDDLLYVVREPGGVHRARGSYRLRVTALEMPKTRALNRSHGVPPPRRARPWPAPSRAAA